MHFFEQDSPSIVSASPKCFSYRQPRRHCRAFAQLTFVFDFAAGKLTQRFTIAALDLGVWLSDRLRNGETDQVAKAKWSWCKKGSVHANAVFERAQTRFNACFPALATPKLALFLSRSRSTA
jgi:hypothetical protein